MKINCFYNVIVLNKKKPLPNGKGEVKSDQGQLIIAKLRASHVYRNSPVA